MIKQNERQMTDYEKRFSEVTGLNVDLSTYPLTDAAQQQTTKEKNKKFGQVFTPLNLCDDMLERYEHWDDDTKTYMDLCAGFGQFGIRIIRKKLTLDPSLDVEKFISENLFFNELQEESCEKLRYIFGENINLFIGDARELEKLPDNARGVWRFDGKDWQHEV